MSARLSVENLTHRYGSLLALDDLSLEAGQGELLAILGPSGCGKSTLLGVVGGFIRQQTGRVLLDGSPLDAVPAHRRPLHTVFQRPALFPQLDVAGNVGYSLRAARWERRDRERRVERTLELVRLEGFAKRSVDELSGGEQQRVALARALADRPPLLLLDEPLASLDLDARRAIRGDLRRLQRESGATWLHVTHDQEEALAIADRVAVLERGRLHQLAEPAELYRRPASPFVARFVGAANVLAVEVVRTSGKLAELAIGPHRLPPAQATGFPPGPAWLVIRPEAVSLSPATERLTAHVVDVEFRGASLHCRLAVLGLPEPLNAELATHDAPPINAGEDTVEVAWDPADALLLKRQASSADC